MSEDRSVSPHEPRVLHVNEQKGWRGGEQQMLYLAQGLAARGVKTAVAAPPDSPAARRAADAGLEVYELSMRGEADLVAAFGLGRIARKHDYNILHSHTSHAHMLALMAARLWMASSHVVVHRRIEYAVGQGMLGLARLKYTLGVDAYVAISNRVKETLVEAGVAEWRAFTVHSSTDPDRFLEVKEPDGLRADLGIPQDAFVIGNIGALVGHKDHDNLLRAARIVRDKIPRAWFVIVGAGPLHERILEKANALHMADRLTMTGFRQDVPELIRMFDLFALSSSEEGICSTLLDVAISGCPIVATDAGGVREAVVPEETGIVVPIKKPHDLAEGIIKLVRHPELARRYAKKGRTRALAHFTCDRMTERTLEVYHKVLAGEVGPENPVGYLDV
jgi:glycosyltransferase involved in cell wall biosynthesis